MGCVGSFYGYIHIQAVLEYYMFECKMINTTNPSVHRIIELQKEKVDKVSHKKENNNRKHQKSLMLKFIRIYPFRFPPLDRPALFDAGSSCFTGSSGASPSTLPSSLAATMTASSV